VISALARVALALVLLVLVYALALGSFAPADLALGSLFAAGALLFCRRVLLEDAHPPPQGGVGRRVVAFVPFSLAVLGHVAVGTWQVALIILGLRPLGAPGVVAVPIEERTEAGVAVSGLAATLSPGELLLDVDWERRVMLFHVIDAHDPDAVREHHRKLYRRHQRRVFP
jgi:multisubunit Na+/H+ antiporter MnhE subunit